MLGCIGKTSSSMSICAPPVRRESRAEVLEQKRGGPASVSEPGETTMRFMMMVKSDASAESGVMPDKQLLDDMNRFNDEMKKAGVMLAGEGLHASAKGARVRCSKATGKVTVIDGPFSETKELVPGFWLIQAKSKAEAVEWAK